MKLSIRLATVAVTAFAFAGVLGAQGRSGGHTSGGSSMRSGGSSMRSGGSSMRAAGSAMRSSASRSSAPRGQSQGFARQNVQMQRYAASRPENRGGNGLVARNDFGGRPNVGVRGNVRGNSAVVGRPNIGARGDFRGNSAVDVRGRGGYGPAGVANHGRPLITRGGLQGSRGYERAVYGGARFGAGFNRWGGRLELPFGWGGNVIFGGYFPASYASYCEAVPDDYDYLLPPMAQTYDPCLFGDRVVVFDRYSRSIVFAATL